MDLILEVSKLCVPSDMAHSPDQDQEWMLGLWPAGVSIRIATNGKENIVEEGL